MKAQDAEEKKKKEERLKARSYALKLEGGAFGDFGHAGFLQVQEKTQNGLTVEAWVKLRAKSGNPDKFVGIVSALGGPVGSEDAKGWFLGADDKTFVWGARSTGEESMTFVKGEKAVDLNRWYHIAGTFNKTQVRLYVNGKLFAWKHLSSGKPMYGGKSPVDDATFMIGSVPGPAAAFSDISVDDIALWNRALAKEELMKHAVMRKETRESLTNAKQNKGNGLISLYNFGPGEVPGTDITDESKVNQINGKVAVVDGASGEATWINEPDVKLNLAAEKPQRKKRTLARRLNPSSMDFAELRSDKAGKNLGLVTTLHAMSNDEKRKEWQFVFKLNDRLFGAGASQIPAKGAITKATLRFFEVEDVASNSTEDAPVVWRLHKATEAWSPTSVTFDDAPAYNQSAFVKATYTNSGWLDIDITSAIREWARDPASNFGMVVASADSRETGQAVMSPVNPVKGKRPQLIVEVIDAHGKPIFVSSKDELTYEQAQVACAEKGAHVCSVDELVKAKEIAGYSNCKPGWTSTPQVNATAGQSKMQIAYVLTAKQPDCDGVAGLNDASWMKKASANCCTGAQEEPEVGEKMRFKKVVSNVVPKKRYLRRALN